MTLAMTSLPLARVFQPLFTFALVSTSRWLAEIWQLSRQGVTGELEVEFKFQRRSCKVASSPSFSRPAARAPRRACSQATSYMAVLIKIHFAFDRFLRLQKVAKIKFTPIQAGGGLIKGCIFLLTARWAYNCEAYKLKTTVDPPEKRDPAAGYRPDNLTNCFLHPFNSSQLIWK